MYIFLVGNVIKYEDNVRKMMNTRTAAEKTDSGTNALRMKKGKGEKHGVFCI